MYLPCSPNAWSGTLEVANLCHTHPYGMRQAYTVGTHDKQYYSDAYRNLPASHRGTADVYRDQESQAACSLALCPYEQYHPIHACRPRARWSHSSNSRGHLPLSGGHATKSLPEE